MPSRRLFTMLLVLFALGLANPAAALDYERLQMAARGEIPWQSLSPEEQRALQQYRGNWNNYSTERQQEMRRGAKRYLDLPPQKRQQVEKKHRQYQQLSPEERERLREEYRRQKR